MNTLHFRKPFLATLSFLLLVINASHSQAQSETERGGGDHYVEEFRTIQIDVLSNIQNWRNSGMLKLSDTETARLQRTMKVLKVFSQDTVQLADESNGEPQGEEVDAINFPYAHPPKIVIGRRRWKQISSPLAKENLVLHELLSVSQIKDGAFERSYLMKLKKTENWLNFKSEHRAYLHELRQLDADFMIANAAIFATYLKFTKNTNDYQNCISSVSQSTDIQASACENLMNLIAKANDPTTQEGMRGEVTRISAKIADLTHQYQRWVSIQEKEWMKLSLNQLNTYQIAHTQQQLHLSSVTSPEALKVSYGTNYGTYEGIAKDIQNYYELMELKIPQKQEAVARHAISQLMIEVEKLDAALANINL